MHSHIVLSLSSHLVYVIHSSEICGTFDCIWDNHAFHVIQPTDRKKWVTVLVTLHCGLIIIYRYAKLCQSLLKPQGKILMCVANYNQSEFRGMYFVIYLLHSYQWYYMQALHFPSQLTYWNRSLVNGCCCSLREFVYIVLLGEEFGVDFLERRDSKLQIKLIKNLEEGLYFLAKQN